MPGTVLKLTNAYDDYPTHDDEPMFRSTPRLTGSGASTGRTTTPRPIGWTTPAPAGSPLRLSDRPASFDGLGNDDDLYKDLFGSRARSPLALPAPSSPFYPASPPPKYSTRGGEEPLDNFPNDPKTPYEVLGVSEYASNAEIKKAYKKRALAFHPDKCQGHAAAVEEADRRFKLIAEAYAILGMPERRAEYDSMKREQAKARSSYPYKPKAAPSATFKSHFTPPPMYKSSAAWDSEEDDNQGPQDLRNLDAFALFNSMFPSLTKQFGMGQHRTERGQPRDAQFDAQDKFGSFGGMGDLLNDPLLAQPSMTGRKAKSGNHRTVTEKQENAHMDRHGRLEFSQSERTMKVHKSGGFSYSSTSVSGSFGPGTSGTMLAALMGGGLSLGAQGGSSGSVGGAWQSMLGGPDYGTALPRRRRPSFGDFEGRLNPPMSEPTTPSRSLARRPSLSEPLTSSYGLPSPSFGSDRALEPYDRGNGSMSRFGGW